MAINAPQALQRRASPDPRSPSIAAAAGPSPVNAAGNPSALSWLDDRPMTAALRLATDQRETLLQLVSEGMTKTAACAQMGLPVTVATGWILRDEEFQKRWRMARVEQAHSLADQALAIADEDAHDSASVLRNRLRVDTRKWLTSKIAPKMYGERIMNDHTHTVGVVVLPGLSQTTVPGQTELSQTTQTTGNKRLPTPEVSGTRANHESVKDVSELPRDLESPDHG